MGAADIPLPQVIIGTIPMMGCLTPWSTWCSWDLRHILIKVSLITEWNCHLLAFYDTRDFLISWPLSLLIAFAFSVILSQPSGVLDKLANRCMADGTNAWTATDHTAYTLSTAGSEGAVNLMPIFADHVLFPTLTDSGFVTEVHHVNGKGEDKGVVYCEMQASQNILMIA